MAVHDRITAEQAALIEASPLFFTASVHPDLHDGPNGEGPVNLSPKGMTRLHVLDEHTVAYLDYPGSGNETARHAVADGPITVMVMSMTSDDAAIVRLYGRARSVPIDDSTHRDRLLDGAPKPDKARQVIEITVDRTQTSCGYGVPIYEFVGQRPREGRGKKYRD